MKISRLTKRTLMAFGLPILLFAAWWFASTDSVSFFWPPLHKILGIFPDTWLGDRLLQDVIPSVLRLIAGYVGALVVGVALGVAIGLSKTLRATTEPVLEFFRAIPPPVLIPILILFAGIGDTMKVLVIVIGCVWPILLNTVEGVRALDEVLLSTARCYQMRPGSRLVNLVLRGASPQIATGARQSLSIGIILMVISEMFAGTNGVGFTIVQFQRLFQIPQMWSGIILLGIIGIALSFIYQAIENRLLSWHIGLHKTSKAR